MPRRLPALLLAGLVLACGDATDAEPVPATLRLGHVAPDVGAVRLVVDGEERVALTYGTAGPGLELDPGEHRVRVDVAGALEDIATTLQLDEATDYTLALAAPDGSKLLTFSYHRTFGTVSTGKVFLLNAVPGDSMVFNIEGDGVRGSTTLAMGDTTSFGFPSGSYIATVAPVSDTTAKVTLPPFRIPSGGAVVAALIPPAVGDGYAFLAY